MNVLALTWLVYITYSVDEWMSGRQVEFRTQTERANEIVFVVSDPGLRYQSYTLYKRGG